MAIRVEPKGYAEAMIGLARLAGESRAAERAINIAETRAASVRNRQYDLELEQLRHQWEIESYNRQQAWNLEKMELASRADFMREEQERQRKIDEFNAKKKAIEDSNILTEDEKGLRILELQTGLKLYQKEKEPKLTERTDVDAAVKFLTDYDEKYGGVWYLPKFLEAKPTEYEEKAKDYYMNILESAGIPLSKIKPIENISKPTYSPPEKVIRQRNKITGQERISYDGGKTWEML
jgi:hypothetical protein